LGIEFEAALPNLVNPAIKPNPIGEAALPENEKGGNMTSQVHSNQIVAKGKSRRRNLALVAGLAALLLAVLGLYAGLSASPQVAEDQMASKAAFRAANPELMVARRYAAVPVRKAESNFLAANPELLVARRYIAPATVRTESAFMAANPELMVAGRYTAIPAAKTESNFLAANPELLVARRYIAPATVRTESAFLAANPELLVARRYIAGAAQQSDPAFLAANPEIMLHRRYVAAQQATDDEREGLCCR
jgi:hypothetical protein